MSEQSNDAELRAVAERTVHAKAQFRGHLLVYLVVNLGLVAWNLLTWPQNLWSLWSVVCWGAAVLAQGWAVYGNTDERRARSIDQEMDRLRRRAQRV